MNLVIKNILIATILLSNIGYASERKLLDKADISKIYIYSNTSNITKIYLTENEEKEFINGWNKAKERGPCKYRVAIWAIVESESINNRKFRISYNNIKENNDYCYTFSKELSNKLYGKIK